MHGKKLFQTADKQIVYLNDLFLDASLFLCCSGPSLLTYDLTRLQNLPTMAVNNCPVALRKHGGFSPDFWTMTDDVPNFVASIYEDPKIIKFLPEGKCTNKLFDNNKWDRQSSGDDCFKMRLVDDCPGVLYYRRPRKEDEFFSPDTFFALDEFCWGNWAQRCACGYVRPEEVKDKLCPQCQRRDHWGSRSCMLVAVRIAYELGFRNVFLLGCDFKMEMGAANYAFPQDRAAGSIRNNNQTYMMLNERFTALQPEFLRRGFYVWNCLQDSGLKSFPFKHFDECVAMATVIPIEDRTDGLYDRKAKNKGEEKKGKKEIPGKPSTLIEFLERKRKK